MKPFGRVSRRCTSAICVIALLAASLAHAFGQGTPKRSITHQDYDSWHSIQSPQISRDGKFIAYAYMAQDADSVHTTPSSRYGSSDDGSMSSERSVLLRVSRRDPGRRQADLQPHSRAAMSLTVSCK